MVHRCHIAVVEDMVVIVAVAVAVVVDVDIPVREGVLEAVMVLVNGDVKPHAGVVVPAVL